MCQQNWVLRSPIIWHRDKCLPEDVWRIPARPKNGRLNTAPFPDELVEQCLALGCKKDPRKPENRVRKIGDKQQYRYLYYHERHFQSDTAVGNGQTGAMGFCLLTKLKSFFLPYRSFWPRKGRYRPFFESE